MYPVQFFFKFQLYILRLRYYIYVTNGERYDFSHFFSTIQFFCCTTFVLCADPSCAAVIYHHDHFLCNFIYRVDFKKNDLFL